MIENIKNKISQIKLTEFIDSFTKPKEIPSKPLVDNSKVLLEILDKIGEREYKILVNGKLFVSELPDNFKKGDILLAKILRANPLTLSLINLLEFSEINDKQKLAILLQYLKIPNTENAIDLLKAFIKLKIPVQKERFERLLELISETGLIFDNSQLEILLKLYIFAPTGKYKFDSFLLNLFGEKEDKLYVDLLNSILKLSSICKDETLKKFLYEYLIIDIDDRSKYFQLFDKSKLVLIISELMNNKNLAEYYDYLNAIRLSLLKIVLRNRFLKNIHYKQDFLIIKNKNNLNLIKYHFEAINPEKLPGVDRVILYFKTKILGKIEADLLLNFDKLFIKFIANNDSLSKIDAKKDEFIEKLNKKFRVETKITLYNPEIFNG